MKCPNNKSVAKLFIDDTAGNLLDNVYRLLKTHSISKKDAQKVVKNIIKITMKITLLIRNNQFDEKEMKMGEKFKNSFSNLVMTVISFHEVDFSYDRYFLIESLNKNREILKTLVARVLSDKSLNRIDNIFDTFTDAKFLDEVFKAKDEETVQLKSKIVADIHKLMEEGHL
ncbi:Tumor necrosis factor: alpha-induced protein 8-like protein [Dinothrombium tinctorium]|uniref:Tumor necrosis factor: alpha-induced protein 8-like protein n=1 Tax=Dinothrombium tinctorium TaxID=1965070 RepID=A0A3S3QBG8_9ACAR|nr:Tumor necrosis factor: alpha-induced protein 8-like protein [Dinothrombium tinctorium]